MVTSQAGACQTPTRSPAAVPLSGRPAAQGLYDPKHEHDACGIGMIANIKNRPSHEVVQKGLEILENLEHRGAVGADPLMGDGAGILVQTPHNFFSKVLPFPLPEQHHYAVAMLFYPNTDGLRDRVAAVVHACIAAEGLSVLGERVVPTDNTALSAGVIATQPIIEQLVIARPDGLTLDEFERKLLIVRKVISNTVYGTVPESHSDNGFYVVSMSARTIVYKGMFLAFQLGAFYTDLHDESFESAIALVHQRFSTNTFPSWKLAHPYRMTTHNGEINTIRGNVNWMAARQASVSSPLFGDDIEKIWPISYEGQSDTACFDNALEFLVRGGYSLPHAAMML
ncbi:MAG: glutamate synthase subunit alpha, partial [Devosia sp.]|nr:glutamate synthase subunit alpha [Devosia sp.]